MVKPYQPARMLTFSVIIMTFLQACALCPTGTSTISKGGYVRMEKTRPTHSQEKQILLCRDECAAHQASTCTDFMNGKLDEKKLVHPRTGELLSESARTRFENYCKSAATSPDLYVNACASLDVEQCMNKNGYQYVRKDKTVCAPMKMW